MTTDAIRARLEELRVEVRAERISYSELAELQGLAEHIEAGDVELLEAAGVPEFPEEEDLASDIRNTIRETVLDAGHSLTYAYDGITIEQIEHWLNTATVEDIQHYILGNVQNGILGAMGLVHTDDESAVVPKPKDTADA